MKITKETTVVSEYIELEEKDYYFCIDKSEFTKVTIKDLEDEFCEWTVLVVHYYSDYMGITVSEDYGGEDELPYKFLGFIKGTNSTKEITKELFEERKNEVREQLKRY